MNNGITSAVQQQQQVNEGRSARQCKAYQQLRSLGKILPCARNLHKLQTKLDNLNFRLDQRLRVLPVCLFFRLVVPLILLLLFVFVFSMRIVDH